MGACLVTCGEDLNCSVEEYTARGVNNFYFLEVIKFLWRDVFLKICLSWIPALNTCVSPPRKAGLTKWQEFKECFHSRGQHLCKFMGTKESVCIRKEFNSHRIGLGHQHGRRFIVLGHQYGRRDVM